MPTYFFCKRVRNMKHYKKYFFLCKKCNKIYQMIDNEQNKTELKDVYKCPACALIEEKEQEK